MSDAIEQNAENMKVTRSGDTVKFHIRYENGDVELIELTASEAMKLASMLSDVAVECSEYELEELQ